MFKPMVETHDKGFISVEQNIPWSAFKGDLGIQIDAQGRVWICINGQAFLRFTPYKEKKDERTE